MGFIQTEWVFKNRMGSKQTELNPKNLDNDYDSDYEYDYIKP